MRIKHQELFMRIKYQELLFVIYVYNTKN